MRRPRRPATVPAPAGRIRETSYFDRWDLVALIALTAVAFVLRFFSPLLPDFFVGGPLITNCVTNTPVDPVGDLGSLCGLAYPITKGEPDANGQLSPPNGQVFDEVYFPVDAYDDVKGIELCRPTTVNCRYSYFDPEPPLGKELIAAGEIGFGWYRATFLGAHGDYVDLGFNTFGWRIAVCIFGTLCIPMMYLLARRLWPPRLFAIAAATFVCFDGMFFIQSRVGMIDIFPIFFILLAYFLFLVHLQSKTVAGTMASLVALGIVLGLGISAKWIVLAAYASIVFFIALRIFLRSLKVEFGPPGWQFLGRGTSGQVFWPTYVGIAVAALVVIPLAIYIASWFPFFARGDFHNLKDLWNYQVESYRYHATLKATHPYGSPAWSWPFLARPVLYYANYAIGNDVFTGEPLWARMSNLGNPWIWWTSLPCIAALPYFVVKHRSFPAAVILLGFVSQYLPWFPITRVLFLYHMFGGLIFMVLALAFVLVYLAETLPRPNRSALVAAHLATTVFFFGYFYPVWTGVPIAATAWLETPGATPIWGPKIWLLLNCDVPESKPRLFCWN